MYLTRFDINAQRRGARKLLGSPQAMHAAVLAGFPPSSLQHPSGRVLWRLDSAGPVNTLYLLSPTQPDLTHLVEQAGWPSTASWVSREYRPLLDRLAAGQRWGFRLTANTTRYARLSPDGEFKRYGHVTVEQQQDWFLQRLDRLGVSLAKTAAGDRELILRDRGQRSFQRAGKPVTLTVATFDGILQVQDAELLRGGLTAGIGPAKAYGCGLMTLARV